MFQKDRLVHQLYDGFEASKTRDHQTSRGSCPGTWYQEMALSSAAQGGEQEEGWRGMSGAEWTELDFAYSSAQSSQCGLMS